MSTRKILQNKEFVSIICGLRKAGTSDKLIANLLEITEKQVRYVLRFYQAPELKAIQHTTFVSYSQGELR